MPAQKRYSSNSQDEDAQRRRNQSRRKQSRGGGEERSVAPAEELRRGRIEVETETEEEMLNRDRESIEGSSEDAEFADSDGSGTDPEEFDEMISVSRSEIRTNVQCPVCLGIIKRTRVVMGCQHRFCRECIDKSMRLGNNECPACRIHCASRRSLRDDPGFDALIQAIFPDVEKYEEEELVFHEEERALNQQIQASIAQICQRQSEALIKRRKKKDTNTESTPRGSRNYQNAYSRRRRSGQAPELQQSDNNESEDDHKSPTDEHVTQTKPRRGNRRRGTPTINLEDGNTKSSTERIRENQEDSPKHDVPVFKPETFTWGRGGVRSHVRHGSSSGSASRNVNSNRYSKLIYYLLSDQGNECQQDAQLQLVPTEVEETPSSERPNLCCDSNMSVNGNTGHIAPEVKPEAEDTEIMPVEDRGTENKSTPNSSNSMSEAQIFRDEETLAGIKSSFTNKDLTLGCMQQKTDMRMLDQDLPT